MGCALRKVPGNPGARRRKGRGSIPPTGRVILAVKPWSLTALSFLSFVPFSLAGEIERRGIGQDSRLPRILAMIWTMSGWAASGRRKNEPLSVTILTVLLVESQTTWHVRQWAI